MRQAVNNVINRTKPVLEKTDSGEVIIKNKTTFGDDDYSLLMNNCQDFATKVEKEYINIRGLK